MSTRLQSEIKQRQPFPTLETEAVLNLVRTHEVLRRPLEALLKRHDLSSATYNVLRILRGAEGSGLACGDIGGRMLTRVPDITRLLDRLCGAGLVSRERGAEDRRVVISRITDRGLDLLAGLDEPVTQLQTDLLGHLSEEELTSLVALLEKARSPGG